jgi:hypothetical protein
MHARDGRRGAALGLGIALAALLLISSGAHALDTLDLNGAPWRVVNKNGSLELGPLSLPSYPVEELRKQGIIQDVQFRWVRGGGWAAGSSSMHGTSRGSCVTYTQRRHGAYATCVQA